MTRQAVETSRDEFAQAAAELYGGQPTDFDGLTIAELSQRHSDTQLAGIYARLGVEV